MKIDINKKYRTRTGLDVTIFTTNARVSIVGERMNVIGLIHERNYDSIQFYNQDGKVSSELDMPNDLVEISPYDDFKIDDKVLVWDCDSTKVKGHFAGVSVIDGRPMIWMDGKTSFTSTDGPITFNYCKKLHQ